MSSAFYKGYDCEEGRESSGGRRYKAAVRAKLNGQYVRKYFATKTEAKTWAEMKNIEVETKTGNTSSFRLNCGWQLKLPFGFSSRMECPFWTP